MAHLCVSLTVLGHSRQVSPFDARSASSPKPTAFDGAHPAFRPTCRDAQCREGTVARHGAAMRVGFCTADHRVTRC